jgi:hypothetical protein
MVGGSGTAAITMYGSSIDHLAIRNASTTSSQVYITFDLYYSLETNLADRELLTVC